MRLWDYGIGSFQFHDSSVAYSHNFAFPQSLACASGSDYAGCKNSRKFFALRDEGTKLAGWHVSGFANDLEPDTGFRKFLHGNLKLVNEILAGFCFCCLGVVGGNARGRTKQLVGKAAAANLLRWQGAADVHAARGETNDAVFKVVFCHGSPQSHNCIIPQSHYFTISQSESVIFVFFTLRLCLESAIISLISSIVGSGRSLNCSCACALICDHYIEWIMVDYGNMQIIKEFKPGEIPEVTVETGDNIKAYAYCNKHSLWENKKGE